MCSRWAAVLLMHVAVGAWLWFPGSACPGATRPNAAAPDRAAIEKELTDVSLGGMSRRLGPDYAFYHPKGPSEKFPEVWMVPAKQGPGGRVWQVGGPWTEGAGDYSSTQGQVLYVPDRDFFPVDRVTIIEWAHGCFAEAPLPPWHGGFRPEPAAAKWRQTVPDGDVGLPTAMARGMGYWANNGLAIFSSGLVASGGTVTARGLEPTLRFPPGQLLTAVSVTNKSEFALVTVCNTEKRVGQVAVLALRVDGKKTGFVHEWQDAHAWSLPSVGVFTDIKLLGTIDLPGIEFPTGVCAVGNDVNSRMNGRDGHAGLLREYDLAKQADRDVFAKGSNSRYGSTTGFAVVIGKYENKAAFIDLGPLIQKVRQMYFTTEENYQKTRDSGPGPKQWPYAFEVDPTWKPPVVKVVDVPRPTAVIASLAGGTKARAFIASEDGKVGMYTVGGLATDDPAAPDEIARVGEVQVGRNPTCLAYQKHAWDTFLAVSRGDREIAWIKHSGDDAQVIRRLRDARLLDPVFVEVADTHGIETPLLTVADFKGRQVINYRYGVLVFATQGGARFGMGPDGKDEFECGGVLEFPGSPFCVSATNVN
ncbi:MAG: hypothetical protein IMZ66_05145 [Planctomycetes bacterium]|nr:hypothetical protein [Planctomycetota bacterium]